MQRAWVRGWLASLNYPDASCPAIEASLNRFCLDIGISINTNSALRRKDRSTYPGWFIPEIRLFVARKKLLHLNYKYILFDRDYEAFRGIRQWYQHSYQRMPKSVFCYYQLQLQEEPPVLCGLYEFLNKGQHSTEQYSVQLWLC